jgi:cytochrome c-type biogenesis protein CcmH
MGEQAPGTRRRADGRAGFWRGLCRQAGGALLLPLLLPLLLLALLGPALMLPVSAAEAPEVGENPAAERHMMQLAAELRCLQCQNQTLADSNAPLAVDLRQEIRELLAKGQSDQQVKQYLAARYGDFVFYRPPVQGNTLLLWFGPGLVLVGGLLALYVTLKRRLARLEAEGVTADLSDADARRAQNLLDEETGESSLS